MMERSKPVFTPRPALLILLLVFAPGLAATAFAEMGQIDGHIWQASSLDEKRAYLVGVANVVAVGRALQIENQSLDPDAPLNRIAGAFDGVSIDTAIARIDSWYDTARDRRDTPVIGVLWLGLVKAAQ